MHSTTQKQIQSFVDGVSASIAVLERTDSQYDKVIACNGFFNEMFGGVSQLTQTTPFLLADLIPRYNRMDFLDKIDQCFNDDKPLEFEQAFDSKEGTCWWRISLKPIIGGKQQVTLINHRAGYNQQGTS